MGNVFSLKLMKRSLSAGLIFGLLVLFVFAAVLLSTRLVHATSSGQNCDDNAVVYCGATSVSGLIGKYNDGDGRNTALSIHNIYSWFGITSSDIQTMGSTAQNGSVTSSGDVYAGNTLVATAALTGGRQNIQPGSNQQDSQGTIFYTRLPSVSFLSSPLSAFVVMKNGVFQFAILTSCGNPVTATPKTTAPAPTPTPTPTTTTPTPTPTTTPPPAATSTTTPTSTPTPIATAPSVNICSGNTTSTNIAGVASQGGGNCSTTTNTTTIVTPASSSQTPVGQCTGLIVEASQPNAMTITAAVSFQALGGAQLQNITYNFGNNSAPTAPTTQTVTSYTYPQAGTYMVTATLNFTGSQAMAPSVCQAPITVTAPPAPTTSPTTTSTPAPTVTTTSAPTTTTPAATTASQLVNTGPGDIVGIFAVSTILGTIGYRIVLGRSLGRL